MLVRSKELAMKSVVLPFTINVELRSYHNNAFPLGIAKANMIDYEIWLCNKYVNVFRSINGVINSYDEDPYTLVDGFPYLAHILSNGA